MKYVSISPRGILQEQDDVKLRTEPKKQPQVGFFAQFRQADDFSCFVKTNFLLMGQTGKKSKT